MVEESGKIVEIRQSWKLKSEKELVNQELERRGEIGRRKKDIELERKVMIT